MIDYNRQHASTTGRYTIYRVPADFDQTPKELETWDYRLLDQDILRIMALLYKNPKPDNSFAFSNCPTKHCHFSPPYSNLACTALGFPATNP
jgi:hypothetical protein